MSNNFLQMNHFISDTTPFASLTVYEYRITSDQVGYRQRMALANTLTSRHQLVCPTSNGLLSTMKLDLNSDDYVFHDFYIINAEEHNAIVEKLAESWFRNLCKNNGFHLQEQGMMFSQHYESKMQIRIYEGIKTTVNVMPTGQVIVVLDPKYHFFQELTQYLRSHGYHLNGASNLRVKVPSAGTMRWISGVLMEKTNRVASDLIPHREETYQEYWQKGSKAYFCGMWDLNISEDDTIYSIKIGDEIVLHYPESVVRVSIDLSNLQGNPAGIASTSDRIDQTLTAAKKLLTRITRKDNLRFSFVTQMLRLSVNSVAGYESGKLYRPSIAYAKAGTGQHVIRTPSKDSDVVANLKTFGPHSGRVNLSMDIIHITDVNPTNSNLGGLIRPAFSNLLKSYNRCKLGIITPGQSHKLIYTNQAQFRKDLKTLSYSTHLNHRAITLMILDVKKDRQVYIQSKRVMTELGLPSKMMTRNTLKTLGGNRSKSQTSTSQIIALQLYARSLYPGESALLLEKPSKGLPEGNVPVILTMDISRDLEHDEYGVGEITAFSGLGLLLSASSKKRFKEKQFNRQMVVDWFIETVSEAAEFSVKLVLQKPNAFIFMYDGAMNSSQVEVLEEASRDALNQMVNANILPVGSQYAMIEVTKTVPDRVYKGSGQPNIGTYVIDPQLQGYLVASRPYRGTPKLLRCRIRSQSLDYLTIRGLLQFVHDLRHLTPTSPWSQPRDPTPKYLAHNNSNLARMGINPPYIPF